MGRKIDHGQRYTKEYYAWSHMKDRCLNPKNKRYSDYGGRGIKVCESWQASFRNFFNDMGHAPSPSHSLERIENDGNYEKKNCKWATKSEQSANTRKTKILIINGESRKKSEWLKIYGIEKTCFNRRKKKGWTDVQALTTPPMNSHPR